MAEKFIEYLTQDGDRWDLIAYKHYGDSAQIGPIERANLHVPLMPILSAGITLRIPVLDTAQFDINLLPPWERQ
jgi:phage tail protein X